MGDFGTISAARPVPARAAEVYAFLGHLPNHARLAGRRIRLLGVSADPPGGSLALRGPFGIRRTAVTTVAVTERPRAFGGRARVGRRTAARVLWRIEDRGAVSRVTLSATLLSAGPLDRLLLVLGGRRWLRRAFAEAVGNLARELSPDGRVITRIYAADAPAVS